MNEISLCLLQWYHENCRDLPWRHTHDPYAILVSEIMLQQTQVSTVIDYYLRFLNRFSTIGSLAQASEDEVLTLWQGLGYYSRARNLHKAAKHIIAHHDGVFPREMEQIRKLPGIGEYTTGAILSIAFQVPCPAVDGNVLRVIARLFGIEEDITLTPVKKQITTIVKDLIPTENPGDFTQALMELGALICTPKAPVCIQCPLIQFCHAAKNDKTDVLPVKKKKGKQKEEFYTALLCVQEDKLLMTRKHPGTLLKNMWGVPLLKKTDTRIDLNVIEAIGIPIHSVKSLGQVRHVFTHRIWNMDVVFCYTDTPSTEKESFVWTDLNQLNELPIPEAFRKVLRLIE